MSGAYLKPANRLVSGSWYSWLWGQAQVRFYHAKETIALVTNGGSSKSLSEIVQSITPPCYLNPFLMSGHLQTMWTAVKGQNVPVIYKRRIFEQEDPAVAGQFSVDFVVRGKAGGSTAEANVSDEEDSQDPWALPPRTSYFTDEEWDGIASNDTKPMLITLHGLSGGSHEIYLRHVLAPLVEQGWEGLVVNSRGCARTKITSSVLYNARATWDIRQVVKWARKTFPNRPLFGIGYSLGANIITNYIGEEGDQCVFKAAVALSNPWNLELGSAALMDSWLGANLYSKVLGTAMKKLVRRHRDQLVENSRIDFAKIMSIQHLYEFDRHVQGPTWGYPTEGAYYRDASSTDSVLNIRIPFFALHAEDDPVTLRPAIAFEEMKANPFCVLVTTSVGGHLGWFQWGGSRWYVKPVVAFLNKIANEVDHTETAAGLKVLNEEMRGGGGEGGARFFPMRRRLIYHKDQADGSLKI